MCKLLRSKLFPHSPFADDANDIDPVSNRSPSPPARSSRATSKTSKKPPQRSSSVLSSTARSDSRTRSRSLSVSLAQDATTKKSNSGASTTLKRALSREVSMSRTFKPRPNAASKAPEDTRALPILDAGGMKRRRGTGTHGVTLVTATPTKSALVKRSQYALTSPIHSPNLELDLDDDDDNDDGNMNDVEVDDEEMWLPDSSPDILHLKPRKRSVSASSSLDPFEESDDECHVGTRVPVKKRMRL